MSRDVGDPESGPPESADSLPRKHAMLANAVADGLFQVDANGRFVAINDAFLDATSRSREDLVGEPLTRTFPAADADRLTTVQRGLADSEPDAATVSVSLATADGDARPCEVRLKTVDGTTDAAGTVRLGEESGTPSGDDGYTDTLDHTEERLHEETEKFRSLVDAVEEYAIFMLDPDGRITSWNEGAAHIKGYDAGEVLGEHFSIFYTEADRAAGLPEANLEAAETGSVEDEGWRVRADGSRFWANVTITAIDDEDGDLRGYAKVTRDMTSRREREKALRRERDLVAQILETNPVGIAVLDSTGQITRLNETGAAVLGIEPEEASDLEPDNWTVYDEDGDPVPPEEWPQSVALRSGEPVFDWRCELERSDGARRWISANAVPLFDDEGAVERVILTANDISTLKERERDLRRERDLVEQILETNPAGIALVDRDNTILRANERAAVVTGRSVGELLELDSTAIELYDEDREPVPPGDHPSVRAIESDEGVVGGEYRIERPDGEWRWLAIRAASISNDEEGPKAVISAQDVTALKRQQDDLRRERDLVENVIEVSPGMIGVFEADDRSLLRANARAEEFLGLRLTESGDYEYVGGEVSLYDEVGETVPPDERPYAQAIETGEPVYDWLGQMENADGERRWFSINAMPIYEDGHVERVVVVGDDVTQLKEQARQLERQRDDLEHELGEVFERVDDAFYAVDEKFRFTYVNERAEELLRHDEGELLGKNVWEVFPEAAESPAWESLHEALESQEPTSYEVYFDPLDFWVEANVYPSETGLSVYFQDVTERKEREQKLEQYHTVTQAASDAIVVIDEDSTVVSVNPAVADILGYDPEDLEGESITTVMSTEMAEDHRAGLRRYLETGEETMNWDNVELPGRHRDGHEVPLAVSINEFEHDGNRYFAGVIRDITERTERERALEESRNRYQTLVENFPNGAVALVDDELRYTTVGGTPVGDIFETVSELEGGSLDDVLPPDLADVIVPRYVDALEGKRSEFEEEIGDSVFQFSILPVRNDSGDVFAAMGMSQDITERKEHERHLRDAKAQLEAAAEAGAVGTWEWHVREDRFVAGAAMAKQFGVDPDEAREGVSLKQFVHSIHEADRERVMAEIESALETCGGYEAEYRVRNADGELRWVVARGHVECDEDGNPTTFPGALTDITDRKRAERRLQRNNEQLESLFEILPVGVVVADASGRLIEANDTAKEIWGGTVFDAESAEDYERYAATWEDSGEPVEPEEWTMARVIDGEEVTEPDVFEIETDDGERRIIRTEGIPVRDESGEVTRGVVTLTDVTERKERERELERYETIVETINDGIYIVDEQGQFTTVNDEYASMTGYDRAELVGADVSLVVDDDTAHQAQTSQNEMAVGERDSATLEADVRTADGELIPAEATFAILETDDGVERIGVVRDVTERKRRERELEESERRYRTLAENFPSGIVALFDEDLRYTAVGGELFEQTDVAPDDPIGERITERYPPDLVEELEPHFRAALEGEASSFEVEREGWYLHAYTIPVRNADDEVYAGMLVVQDVTELREHERELQTRIRQQEAVTHLGQQALEERNLDALFDETTDRVVEVLDADYCKVLELLPGGEEVLLRSGVGWRDGLVGEATVSTGLDSQAGYTLRTEEPVVVDDLATETRFSGPELLTSHDVTSGISVVLGTPDDPWGVLGVHTTGERAFSEHDVNFVQSVATILATAINRTERERDLERYETIVETIWDGVYALDPEGNFELVNEAFATMLGYEPEELLGEPSSVVHSEELNATTQQMAHEIADGEREAATMELELRTADGDTVPVETQFGPYPYDEGRYGRTGVSRDVTERLERQRALKRQREELAALNRLNQVVGEITHAAVESSSREEIERLVCERLADSESYLFAWIGGVDRTNETVGMRTEAGVEGYLDDVTLAIDPEEGYDGPTARAVRTRDVQVSQNVLADPDYGAWREHARKFGFRSSAAIPITYEDALYGVLNVYSERAGAFDGYERTLLARLGNVVGHTINALERKEALMSDQVVEIEIEMPDLVSYADGPIPEGGTITFDRTVAVGDDTFLEYGTVDDTGLEILEGLVESIPYWEEVAILDDRFGEISFELRLSEPPAISAAASYGGRVQEAAIEDGDFRMIVELPPTADVRAVIEALQTEYPDMELAAQRRTTRETWSAGKIDAVLEERLTDRQRATVEAAYYAGYFDTPRKRNGEEVAESLGITAPTLHQHLRKAQRKLLAAVLDDPEQVEIQ